MRIFVQEFKFLCRTIRSGHYCAKPRDGDVIISTWGKTGTTWMQQIVSQLTFGGAEDISNDILSPWVDLRSLPWGEIAPQIEAQTHRRFLKSHLPADAMVISPKAKYIYMGRDARDVIWSWHEFQMRFTDAGVSLIRDQEGPWPPFVPTIRDIREHYRTWLEGGRDGYDFHPFWTHVQSWWNVRHAPNVILVHYANLKANMPGEIERVAKFLGISVDREAWPRILDHCGFDWMKRNAERMTFLRGDIFEGGAQAFFAKGANGRWRDMLTPEEIARADEVAAKNLTPDCAHWLKTGEMTD